MSQLLQSSSVSMNSEFSDSLFNNPDCFSPEKPSGNDNINKNCQSNNNYTSEAVSSCTIPLRTPSSSGCKVSSGITLADLHNAAKHLKYKYDEKYTNDDKTLYDYDLANGLPSSQSSGIHLNASSSSESSYLTSMSNISPFVNLRPFELITASQPSIQIALRLQMAMKQQLIYLRALSDFDISRHKVDKSNYFTNSISFKTFVHLFKADIYIVPFAVYTLNNGPLINPYPPPSLSHPLFQFANAMELYELHTSLYSGINKYIHKIHCYLWSSIVQAVSQHPEASIYAFSANNSDYSSLWKSLNNRYINSYETEKLEALHEFIMLSKNTCESFRSYQYRVRDLYQKMAVHYNYIIDDALLMLRLEKGMNSAQIHSFYLARTSGLSIFGAVDHIIHSEQSVFRSSTVDTGEAVASVNNANTLRCNICKKTGHKQRDCYYANNNTEVNRPVKYISNDLSYVSNNNSGRQVTTHGKKNDYKNNKNNNRHNNDNNSSNNEYSKDNNYNSNNNGKKRKFKENKRNRIKNRKVSHTNQSSSTENTSVHHANILPCKPMEEPYCRHRYVANDPLSIDCSKGNNSLMSSTAIDNIRMVRTDCAEFSYKSINISNDITVQDEHTPITPEIIMVSGAPKSMFNNIHMFTNLRKTTDNKVFLSNGHQASVEGIGDIGFIKNVLYVPSLTKCLISDAQLDLELKYSFKMSDRQCVISNQLDQPVLVGYLHPSTHLYTFNILDLVPDYYFHCESNSQVHPLSLSLSRS